MGSLMIEVQGIGMIGIETDMIGIMVEAVEKGIEIDVGTAEIGTVEDTDQAERDMIIQIVDQVNAREMMIITETEIIAEMMIVIETVIVIEMMTVIEEAEAGMITIGTGIKEVDIKLILKAFFFLNKTLELVNCSLMALILVDFNCCNFN